MVFNKPEVTIGRVQGNDIVLPEGQRVEASRAHRAQGRQVHHRRSQEHERHVRQRPQDHEPARRQGLRQDLHRRLHRRCRRSGAAEGDGRVGDARRRRRVRSHAAAVDPKCAAPRPTEAVADGGGGRWAAWADGMVPAARARSATTDRAAASGSAASAHRVRVAISMRRASPVHSVSAARARHDAADRAAAASDVRTRSSDRPQPGGTMPPPIAPIPPVAPPRRDRRWPRCGMRRPRSAAPMAQPMPTPMARPDADRRCRGRRCDAAAPAISPPSIAPRVASIADRDAATARPRRSCRSARASEAAPEPRRAGRASASSSRSVSMPSRRGVQLEPLDPKVVKMLDLQSNILERLRAKLDLDKIPMERLHEEDLWQARRARDDRSRRDARDLRRAAEVHRSGHADQGDAERGARARPARGSARRREDRRDHHRSARSRRRRQGRPAARLGQGVLVGRGVRARREAPGRRGRRARSTRRIRSSICACVTARG